MDACADAAGVEPAGTCRTGVQEAGDRDHWLILDRQVPETDAERIELALDLLGNYGQTDGDHHKAWVIDQAVRVLAEDYDAFIAEHRDGEDGPETYSWDEGIAP